MNKGYDYPKPLIEIYERPFFYWATESVRKYVEIASLSFVVLKEHIEQFAIDERITELYPDASVIILPEVTEGAVITCMKGISDINDDLPLVFNDCDHLFKCYEFNSFCQKKDYSEIDGVILSFVSNKQDYSFVEKDNEGNVIRTAEKKAISNEAICGCYYFKNKTIFMESAKEYLFECDYSEYYMSGIYNTMINNNRVVKSMLTDFHVPFGTPEEYVAAKSDIKYKELI